MGVNFSVYAEIPPIALQITAKKPCKGEKLINLPNMTIPRKYTTQ